MRIKTIYVLYPVRKKLIEIAKTTPCSYRDIEELYLDMLEYKKTKDTKKLISILNRYGYEKLFIVKMVAKVAGLKLIKEER